ncbi:hypothetical protein [Pseudalkalibacillus decolorationis]|uniref:hypothetical protein n=1 Tax=Pseudalkalibacillus decolorationis TaxID=163879 RepID=UPI002147AED3|nr:hypothetical protein [Pseudalkalibacillus decolorationis]
MRLKNRREKGFIMVDLVSYCMVLWFAIIHMVCTKQQEWNFSTPTFCKFVKVQHEITVKRNRNQIIRKLRRSELFRLKGDVLWDTS